MLLLGRHKGENSRSEQTHEISFTWGSSSFTERLSDTHLLRPGSARGWRFGEGCSQDLCRETQHKTDRRSVCVCLGVSAYVGRSFMFSLLLSASFCVFSLLPSCPILNSLSVPPFPSVLSFLFPRLPAPSLPPSPAPSALLPSLLSSFILNLFPALLSLLPSFFSLPLIISPSLSPKDGSGFSLDKSHWFSLPSKHRSPWVSPAQGWWLPGLLCPQWTCVCILLSSGATLCKSRPA